MSPYQPTWLVALLLGAMTPAQQTPPQPKEPPAAAAQGPDAKAAFDALRKEYGLAQRAYATKYQEEAAKTEKENAEKAEKDRQPIKAFSFEELAAEWTPKFLAGADQFKGQPGAFQFLLWLQGNGAPAVRDTALATLLADHIASPEFGRVAMVTAGQSKALGVDRVREIFAAILAKNSNDDVQAQVLLSRANLVLEAKTPPDAAGRQAALADLSAGIAKAKDKRLKAQLEGNLYEQEHLQIGMVAPEIEGKDLDGVAFKLSDYRGKVLLLDFWGYW
jgi:hypothetical protein